MATQGMKLTMSALPGGLTTSPQGQKLLETKFVLQCPPMNLFPIIKAFTTTNYDTIDNLQFSSIVSHQLRTFTFDSLVMELGVKPKPHHPHKKQHKLGAGLLTAGSALTGSAAQNVKKKAPAISYAGQPHTPTWVPYPAFNNGKKTDPVAPAWYVDQLDKLVASGAPFKFVATFPNGANLQPGIQVSAKSVSPTLSCYAQLLSFQETYNAGEGDAIYLTSMSFSEWRDPLQAQRGLGAGGGKNVKLPTSVTIDAKGHVGGSGFSKDDATLVDLAKYFYHDASDWKILAQVNKIHGIGQNDQLGKAPKYKSLKGKQTTKIKIPTIASGKQQVYGSQ